jgi:hypothetical protein
MKRFQWRGPWLAIALFEIASVGAVLLIESIRGRTLSGNRLTDILGTAGVLLAIAIVLFRRSRRRRRERSNDEQAGTDAAISGDAPRKGRHGPTSGRSCRGSGSKPAPGDK